MSTPIRLDLSQGGAASDRLAGAGLALAGRRLALQAGAGLSRLLSAAAAAAATATATTGDLEIAGEIGDEDGEYEGRDGDAGEDPRGD